MGASGQARSSFFGGRQVKRHRVIGALLAGAMLLAALPASAAPPGDPSIQESHDPVDLVFLVDGSGSIDTADWQTQLDGYAAALQDPSTFPRDGSLAVGVVQWSANPFEADARLEIPLTVIDSHATASDLVTQLLAIEQIGSLTNPGDGVRMGADHLAGAGRADASGYLCMSTDGLTNSGESLGSAVNYAKTVGVDRYGVIAIEDPPLDESDFEAHYGPHVFGGGIVAVAENSIEFASMVAGCVNDAMEVVAIEVTQALQNWENAVPLVAGKPTVVRAFVQTADGESARTTGRLHAFSGGTELSGSPRQASNDNGRILADDDATDGRDELDGSLNFQLPIAWTFEDDLTLEVELPAGQFCDTGSGTAFTCEQDVSFVDADRYRFKLLGFEWEENGDRQAVTLAELMEVEQRVISVLPVGAFESETEWMALGGRPSGLLSVNTRIAAAKALDLDLTDRDWHGVLPGDPDPGDYAGYAVGNISSAWLSGAGARTATGYARNRSVHELGHSLGQGHIVNADRNGRRWYLAKQGWCGEEAGAFAPDYPHFFTNRAGDEVPTIGPVGTTATEVWGLDVRFVTGDEDLAITDPRVRYPLMSYCNEIEPGQGRWISQRTYEEILVDQFDAEAVTAAATVSDGLLVRGVVAADTGQVEFAPMLPLESATLTPPVDGAAYELRLLDGAGTVIEALPFEPAEMHGDEPPGGLGVDAQPAPQLIDVVVADHPDLATVVVLHDGERIGALAASASAPQVTVAAPRPGDIGTDRVFLSWSGSDPDGDPVTYAVQYTDDAETGWRTLGVDLEATSMQVPRWAVPGSDQAQLRVIASDGFHTAVATSETFRLGNVAPTVVIEAPADGQAFTGLQYVPLRAVAVDPEDGRLDGTSVTWASDRDGIVAVGADTDVRADELSEGTHVLTVTATDAGGATSQGSVTIHVTRVPPPPQRFEFGGFEPPVRAGETTLEQAGRTIPVKWSVLGEADDERAVVSAAFDAAGATYTEVRSGGDYHVNVKTPKTWAGTQQTFRVVLSDGQQFTATFEFR